MYKKAKDHLLLGSIPDDIESPKSNSLCQQLAVPGYSINNSGKLVIESKKSIQDRGEASPDDADAFCLTFAQAVAVPKTKPKEEIQYRYPGQQAQAWMG
jgi:hypothetical protein